MQNLIKTLHNWGGFLIFIPLFLTCFTGAILGVEDLLNRADDKGQQYQAMSFEEKSAMYSAMLEKDNSFTRFRTPHENRPYASAFSRGHTKFYDANMQLIDEKVRADRPIMNGIFFFHRHFLIGSNGFIINGVVSILAVLFIVFGVYLWWVKYRRIPMKRAIPKSFKTSALFNSHILLGVIIAAPFVVLSYTGFHLVFGNDLFGREDNTIQQNDLYFTAGDIQAQLNEAQAYWSGKELVSLVRILERAKATERSNRTQQRNSERANGRTQQNSGSQANSMLDSQGQIERSENRQRRGRPQMVMTGLELRFTDYNSLSPQGADSIKIRLETGEVFHKTVFDELPFSEKLKAYVRPLHDGLNLPSFYVWLITITSFIASIILLFSTYTFGKRLLPNAKTKRNGDARAHG